MFKGWKGMFITAAILLLTVAGCSPASEEAATATPEPVAMVTLRISGSGSTAGLLSAVEAAFEADTPGYRLEVLAGTGTGGGVQGVVQGTLDVAAMARSPKDDEELEFVEFGRIGHAILIHPSENVADLTSEQIRALFAGEIANWSEVGGSDQSVILFVRDEGDSSTAALRVAVWADMPFPKSAAVLTSQGDMIAAVERTQGAVGFGAWPAVRAAGANVNAVALDGVAPSDPAYPVTGTAGIGYLAERKADVQPLIDWLLSERGQAALRELDVIIAQ